MLTTYIRHHPLLGFIALTFSISYLVGIPFNNLVFNQITNSHEIVITYAPILITVLAPALSALIMTKLLNGRVGIREKLSSLSITKQTILPFCITPIITYFFTICTLVLIDIEPLILFKLSFHNWHLFVLHLAAQFFIVGIGEELGWRGWLLPYFLQTKSVAHATFLVFLIWSIWHLPKLMQSPFTVAVAFVLGFFALSTILSWVWLKYRGNIGLIAMIHASVNAPLFFIRGSSGSKYGITLDAIYTSWQIQCATYFILATLLLLFHKKNWWSRPKATRKHRVQV
jgi:uncharacterized protein